MPKMPLDRARTLAILLCSLFTMASLLGQGVNGGKQYLTGYLSQLEERFNVKFSFLNQDLDELQIKVPPKDDLPGILNALGEQVQLEIEKLNERYYAISLRESLNLCATVLDNFERNTVSGATVRVLGESTAIITDLDGHFQLEGVNRDAKLEIRHLGYKPLFVNAIGLVDTSPCHTLLLVPNINRLNEVIVYKFLTEGLTKQADASLEINTDQFSILPGLTEPDVLQTAQALPGIKSIDETVSQINIRGGSNDQNLILWDGIKMYQSGHFFGLITAFNPYLTQTVTAITNGTSAEFGDGVSGILKIDTKDKLIPKAFGGGGFNLISGDAYAHIPIADSLAIQFSARRSTTDFFNSPTYGEFFDRAFQHSQVQSDENEEIIRSEDFYFYDISAKVLYDPNDHHQIRLSLININNDLDYRESNLANSRILGSDLAQKNLSIGGSLKSKWNPVFSTHLHAYHTKYDLTSRSIYESSGQTLEQKNLVDENALKVHTFWNVGTPFLWESGYQFTETSITNQTSVSQPPFESMAKGVVQSHALYSQLRYQSPNKRLLAQTGMRLNYYKNRDSLATFDKFLAEPRLNLSYEIVKDLTVEALGEFKSQATHQIVDLEQNFLGVEKRRWILSNEKDLPIITSKQGSLGISYDHNKLYTGLTGFYKKVNGVSISTQGFENEYQFNGEIGEYDVRGVEVLLNAKTEITSAWLSYTYNENTYEYDALDPNRFPNNFDVRHDVTFGGIVTMDSFKLAFGINYRTGKPYTQPDGESPLNTSLFPTRINYQPPNSSRLPEYFRADASALYDFKLSDGINAKVGLSVLNFTNRKNILDTYYRLTDDNQIETIETVSLGLTPNFSFRVGF